MICIPNPCTDAHWNMAHDAFLLEQRPDTLCCLWQNAPAVIIGRNQSAYAEVNLPFLRERGILLARRVTGGGAVYHDLGNLNYSIAGPAKIIENHYDTIASALRGMGLPVERSGRNDLLLDGRKCSGYAKRLYKDRMLIHGTLLWDVDLETLTEALSVPGSKMEAAGVASVRSRVVNLKPYLPQYRTVEAFRCALQEILAGTDPETSLSAAELAVISAEADKKFRRWEWIYGESPVTAFENRKKFPCGTVEARFTLKHGLLETLEFRGDFIGEKPAEELAAMLTGHRPEDLLRLPVKAYFDGLEAAELLALFEGC